MRFTVLFIEKKIRLVTTKSMQDTKYNTLFTVYVPKTLEHDHHFYTFIYF